MFANIFTLGFLVIAVISGVLSVDVDDGKFVTPLATTWEAQATIWLVKKEKAVTTNRFLCSASVVEHDHVLAHSTCIELYQADNLRVALGKLNLTSTATFYSVLNITYETETHMALVRTEDKTFEATSVVTLRDKPLVENSVCFMGGWLDKNSNWKQHPVTYVDDLKCKADYAPSKAPFEEGCICAAGEPDHNCGSLGMSLTCDDQLTGLFSLVDWECKLPAQCTGVPHSREWIKNQLALARGGASNMQPSLFAAIAAILVVYNTLA